MRHIEVTPRRTAFSRRSRIVDIAILACLATGCGGDPPADAPTFARDVAPILREHCIACHHDGGSAPFPLTTHRDASRQAHQIARVTEIGYMPPWQPIPGEHALVGERRLDADEVATLGAWLAAGTPEGDPADLPPSPDITPGWPLGEPDLVLELPEPYRLRADGPDVFRNVVLPVPVETTRWVRAFDLWPRVPRAVHHAIVQIDRSGRSAARDARDREPGFDGMEIETSHAPDGHFLGWTPGKVPLPPAEGMAWRLDPGTDLVVQLHLLPSGKPEEISPRIGLYFTDEPPRDRPWIVTLYDESIDIPAGAAEHVVTDGLVLPVDLEVLSLYPHAHYIGKSMTIDATLPDGATTTLLQIPDWDFKWQDEYRFETPPALPAGTTLAMRYTYDNTAENVRNPHSPPRRVRYGLRSEDEMATLTAQVRLAPGADPLRLNEAIARRMLEKNGADWDGHRVLGAVLRELGDLDAAIAHLERASALRPGSTEIENELGRARLDAGDVHGALAAFEAVIRVDPNLASAHFNAGLAYTALDRYDRAVASFERATALDGSSAESWSALGALRLLTGDLDEALRVLRRAVALDPGLADAHNNLGHALSLAGDVAAAETSLREAAYLDPTNVRAVSNLARLVERAGRTAEARELYREWLRLAPGDADARAGLRRTGG